LLSNIILCFSKIIKLNDVKISTKQIHWDNENINSQALKFAKLYASKQSIVGENEQNMKWNLKNETNFKRFWELKIKCGNELNQTSWKNIKNRWRK